MTDSTPPEQARAALLAALGHPARLQILALLQEGEVCVCHIQACLNARQAYVSQHLNLLRQAGLVSARKDGHRVYYRAASPAVFDLLDQATAVLIDLGRLSAEAAASGPRPPQTCTCPQCVAEKPELEPIYA